MVVATEQFVRGMRNARLGRLDEVTGGPWRGHFAPAPTERCLRTGYDGTNELNQLQEWKRRGAPKQQWAQQPTQQHVYHIEEHGATGRRLLFDVISRDAHGSSFLALQYGAALCLCGVRDLFNGNYAISCARPSPGRCTLITVALEFENYEAFHNPVGKGVKRPTLNRWTGGFRQGLNVSLYRHVHCEPRGTTPRATGLLNAPGSWVRKHDRGDEATAQPEAYSFNSTVLTAVGALENCFARGERSQVHRRLEAIGSSHLGAAMGCLQHTMTGRDVCMLRRQRAGTCLQLETVARQRQVPAQQAQLYAQLQQNCTADQRLARAISTTCAKSVVTVPKGDAGLQDKCGTDGLRQLRTLAKCSNSLPQALKHIEQKKPLTQLATGCWGGAGWVGRPEVCYHKGGTVASVLALLRMAILTQNTARPWSAQDVLLLSLDVAHDAIRFANMDSMLEDLEELLEVLKEVRASPHHREAHVVLLNAIPWTRGTSTGWRNSWGAAAVNAHLTSWVRKSQLNVIVVDSGPIVGPRMDAHPDATHFLAPDCSGPAGYALMRHTMAAVCSAWSKRHPMRS